MAIHKFYPFNIVWAKFLYKIIYFPINVLYKKNVLFIFIVFWPIYGRQIHRRSVLLYRLLFL